MRLDTVGLLLASMAFGGCGVFAEADPDDDNSVTGPVTDTDDTDEPVEPEPDGTTQTEDSEAFDCDQSVSPETLLDDCVTAEVACGDGFIATTVGGSQHLTDKAYERWNCTPFPEEYNANERIYHFTHPGNGTVTFHLDSPCAEMDIAVVRWEYWVTDGDCPNEDTIIGECEMDATDKGGSVDVWDSSENHYLVVVASRDVNDLFRLRIDCPD